MKIVPQSAKTMRPEIWQANLLDAEDLMRTRTLVAKLTGKPAPDIVVEENPTDKKSKIVHKKILTEEKKEKVVEERKNPSRKTVDAVINELQDDPTSPNEEGEFAYLKQEEEDDPYSLIYCNFKQIEKSTGRYYTITRKGLTSYFNNEPTEFLTIVEWIMEREMFQQIKTFKFFKLFRLWKAIKSWRHSVVFKKRDEIKKCLERKLLLARPGFSNLLVQHRTRCRDLETQRLFDISEQDEAPTLEKYEGNQDSYLRKMSNKILEVSKKSKEQFQQEITTTLENLKKMIREDKQIEEEKNNSEKQAVSKKPGLPNMLMAQISPGQEAGKAMEVDVVYERLGFPSNLSYTHRTEVRKECKMFIRFSYLLDFMAKTSLSAMFLNSIQILDTVLKAHNEIEIPKELPLLKITQDFVVERSQKPLLCIQINLQDNPIPDTEIIYEDVEAYEEPPCGKLNETTFDPTCHLQLTEDYEKLKNKMLQEKVVRGVKVKKAIVKSIGDLWLKLSPEVKDIKKAFNKCVQNMLVALKSYERHSKNEMLDSYASVLEDWDEKVADKWEILEDKRLTCEEILEDLNEYMEKDNMIEKHIKKMNGNISNYLGLLEKYLINYWKHCNIPWDLVENEGLRLPGQVITLLVKQIRKYKEEIPTRIPNKADLGLCKLDIKKLKERLYKSTTQAHNKVETIMVKLLNISQ